MSHLQLGATQKDMLESKPFHLAFLTVHLNLGAFKTIFKWIRGSSLHRLILQNSQHYNSGLHRIRNHHTLPYFS